MQLLPGSLLLPQESLGTRLGTLTSLSFFLSLPLSLAATYSSQCNLSSPNSKAYFDPVSVLSLRVRKPVPTVARPRQHTKVNVTSVHVHYGAAHTVWP